jgi:hypothetical protein
MSSPSHTLSWYLFNSSYLCPPVAQIYTQRDLFLSSLFLEGPPRGPYLFVISSPAGYLRAIFFLAKVDVENYGEYMLVCQRHFVATPTTVYNILTPIPIMGYYDHYEGTLA